MKNNFIILCDTRQQKDKYITDYFDKNNIQWIRTTLPSADYMKVVYKNDIGLIKDYSVLIDTKKDVEELVGNLCKSTEHNRVKKEIEKARELGCEQFVFLICDNNIKTADDIKNWSSKHTKVKGDTLYKIMNTFKEHHNCRFIIVPKKKMGEMIIKLLGGNKNE